MDLTTYREAAGRYLEERAEAVYRYVAGKVPVLDLAPLYERWGDDLFGDARIRELHEVLERCEPGARRSIRYLAHFALLQNLARRVHGQEAALAAAARTPDGDGADDGSLELVLANSPDRDRRRQAWETLTGRLASRRPLLRQRLAGRREGVRDLTGRSHGEHLEALTGLHLDRMRRQIEEFLAASREYHATLLGRFAESLLGLSREELQPWDLPHLLRGARYDASFGVVRPHSLLKRTLMGMGFDLKKLSNIVIDAEERPGKAVEPRCIWVRVPERIYLVLRPQGGLFDVLSLFHEAGTALMAAHVAPEESLETRHLGDRAVRLAFGHLFEGLVLNEEWLADYVRLADADEFRAFMRLRRLHALRSQAVRFLLELEYYGPAEPAEDEIAELLARRLRDALGPEVLPERCMADMEEPFRGAAVLRAWIVEAELREILSERFGSRWYSRPATGDLLRELWRDGGRFTVEELVARIRNLGLHMGPLTRELA